MGMAGAGSAGHVSHQEEAGARMYAVICDPGDRSALWAVDRLRARLGEVRLVAMDLFGLGGALHWQLEAGAAPSASLRLPDGGELDTRGCRAVLNRAQAFPRVSGGDADAAYVREELAAISLAFLAAFGARIFNRPDPLHPGGRLLSTAAWRRLAARAGFPAAPVVVGGTAAPTPPVAQRSLVIGETVLAAEPAIAGLSRSLAALSGHSILGLGFSAEGALCEATALPDLSWGGEAAADALAELLEGAR